jgi:hypothetical protein
MPNTNRMNTMSITVSAKDTGSPETAVIVNGVRLGTVVLTRTVEPQFCGLSPIPVFEAFGLDDISRGEFGSRAAAALSLIEA